MNQASNLSISRWRIQYGGKIQYVERVLKSIDLHKIWYAGVFGVTDHESVSRFSNFKMADLVWRLKIQNGGFFV